ncbi:MAG: sulfotransferase family 2 domain-containing protein [Pseudomonadales bacterium]|nr:sulfotransferase family 2 domain-containing protein [Pseudomonadales bacterium]
MFESLRSQYKSFSSRRKIRREKPEIWLLEDKKVGYVQIPKVATRSIRASLSKSILEGQGVFVDYDELDGQMVKGVEQYSTIRATQAHIQKLRSEYFIFSFIRDPYERLYSCYKNKVIAPLTNNKRNVLAKHGIELGIPFEEFVGRVSMIPDSQADRHIRSQSWFVTDGESLVVDFLGRLEHFHEDWAKLADKFGLPEPTVQNASDKGSDNSYNPYTEKALGIVQQRYAKDIELYNAALTGLGS